MKKIAILGMALALVAAGCGGGEGDQAENEPTSTTANPNDEQVLSGEPSDNNDETTRSTAISAVWVPSSLALSEFIEVELAEDGIDLAVTEQNATYDEIETKAQAALNNGEAVLVPATIGARLAGAGAGVAARLFESSDAADAVSQLGVWLLAPPEKNEEVSFQPGEPAVRTVAVELAQPGPSSGADINVVGEVLTIAGEEADAVLDSKIQTAVFETGAAVVQELAEKYGTRAGGSVGARTIAKAAGPVASVLDFMYTMYQFEEAASEMIEAESRARSSSYETGMTAVAMLSDAHRRLCALKTPLNSGNLDPADAQELIDGLTRSARRAVGVGNQTVTDMNEFGDEANAAQIAQLIESRNATLLAKIIEMTNLATERAELVSSSTIVSGPITSALTSVLSNESANQAIGGALQVLFGNPEPGNQSVHSNGVLTVQSAGNTDIIRNGQFTFEPGDGGPGMDTLFPCGAGNDGLILCGASAPDQGQFVVVLTEFDGPLPTGPTDRYYQYGVVFDRNDDPIDNYRAGSSFPSDTWDNTDYWVEIAGGPAGMSLTVTDATTSSRVETGARAVISGNTLVVLMPLAEIGGGPNDPAVPFRSTSFWHVGDFGLDPPNEFNIDALPAVGMSLALPGETVLLTGPSGSPRPLFDEKRLNDTLDSIAAGLSGFQPETPSVDDPAVLNNEDACWASAQVFGDPTELGRGQLAFSYAGTLVNIRVTVHDSESAARGSARFRHLSVNSGCRDALISSVGGADDVLTETTFEDSRGSVRRTNFTIDGNPFESMSGAFYHGELTVRYSLTGLGDTSMVAEQILSAVQDALDPDS